jgi:hypothetical protein
VESGWLIVKCQHFHNTACLFARTDDRLASIWISCDCWRKYTDARLPELLQRWGATDRFHCCNSFPLTHWAVTALRSDGPSHCSNNTGCSSILKALARVMVGAVHCLGNGLPVAFNTGTQRASVPLRA